jgi:hypothetical protein
MCLFILCVCVCVCVTLHQSMCLKHLLRMCHYKLTEFYPKHTVGTKVCHAGDIACWLCPCLRTVLNTENALLYEMNSPERAICTAHACSI